MKKTICNSILISLLLSSGLSASEKNIVKETKISKNNDKTLLDEKNKKEPEIKEEKLQEKNNLIKKITTNITVVTTTEIIQKNPDNTETLISKTIDSPVTDETIDIVNPEDKIIKDNLVNVQEIIEKSNKMTEEDKKIYISEKIKLIDSKIKSVKKKINELTGNDIQKDDDKDNKKTEEIKEDINKLKSTEVDNKKTEEIKEDINKLKSNEVDNKKTEDVKEDIDKELLKLNEEFDNKKIEDYSKHL